MSVRASFAVAILAALLPVSDLPACSCYVRPLSDRYEHASVVFLAYAQAQIEGFDAFGRPTRARSFQPREVFKGEISFDALTGGDCGGYLAEGKEFLVFANDRGEISDCTSANIEKNERFRADLEVLRLFRDGKLESLPEPWVFTRGGGTCQLTHDLAFGGGSLWFVYRYEDAEPPFFSDKQYRRNRTTGIGEEVPDAKPHPANYAGFLSLRAWFPHWGHMVEGSGRAIVGENSWHTRSADLEANFGPFEELEGGHPREVLDALLSHSSLRLEAEFSDLPDYARARYYNYPLYESGSPDYFAGDAIERFQNCMESGAR